MRQFNFLLQSFALDHLKPRLYSPGEILNASSQDFGKALKKDIENTDANMSTRENGVVPLSMLGTPVFCDMVLRSQDNAISINLNLVLVEINMQKVIVKTAIQGRNGTVKEFISDGDYQVKIRGAISSSFSAAYPKDEVQKMTLLLKRQESIIAVSEFLQIFSVHELVIDSYRLPQKEGFQNVQLFEIDCLSDEPIQLRKSV